MWGESRLPRLNFKAAAVIHVNLEGLNPQALDGEGRHRRGSK
jgi:hypothetical protein